MHPAPHESLPTLALYGMAGDPGQTQDHSICLMQQGQVLHYLQIERATGIKGDNRLDRFIDTLIDQHLIELPERFDLVCVNSRAGNRFASVSGRVVFDAPRQPRLIGDLIPATGRFALGGDNRVATAWLCEHELAHVASCLPFYGGFKPRSLLIHFDAGASLSNFSCYFSEHGGVDGLKPVAWHHDLLTQAGNFDGNALVHALLEEDETSRGSAPGKLMGLAPYGRSSPQLQSWLREHDYFRQGPLPAAKIYDYARSAGYDDARLCPASPFARDLARAFQDDFQDALLAAVLALQAQTGAEHLVYSGGCALNIVANSALVESARFRSVSVPPCPGDSGLALGAAAWLESKKHGGIAPHSPYLNSIGIDHPAPAFSAHTIEQTAALLMAGKVVGLCYGYGEIGPRALGHRSLVALGNSAALRDRVSIECKGRENYRPVAPVMLHEAAQLVTGLPTLPPMARYMLYDFHILPAWHERMQGVVHVDGTARIQVLGEREENPFLHDLLSIVWRRHGIPALINTSFNRRGAPIVHSAADALRAVRELRLDAVVVQGVLTPLA